MRLHGAEEGQLGEPLGGEGYVGDVVPTHKSESWLDVQDVVTDDEAEGHAEVRVEGRVLGRGGNIDAGLAEQIVLAVARDQPTLAIERHVRVVDEEAVGWTAIGYRAVHLLVVVRHHVHLVLPRRTGHALECLYSTETCQCL